MMSKINIEKDALAILNAVPHNYLVLLPDPPRFTIVGVTDAYLKATLTKREEILGRGLFEVFPDNPHLNGATGEKNLGASLNFVLEHKKEHHMVNQRYDVPDPDGGEFVFKVWRPVNKPVFNKAGEIQYIIHNVEEITESVRLTEQARVAREVNESQSKLLNNLFIQLPVAIAIFKGPRHVIEMANEAHLKIWGRTPEEVIGKPVAEALPEVEGHGFEELLTNTYRTGQPFYANELAVDLVREGKKEQVYFNFVYHPFRDLDGSVAGVIVIAHEITEQVVARKKVEENETTLQIKNTELERINANLEEFAYAASHDLKEPVRKVHLFADRLKHDLEDKLNDYQRNIFSRLENAAQRMGILIDDLLTYSHVSKGLENREEINLNDKVRLVLEDLELEIAEKKARVTVDPLPNVKGHRRQLQQLFQNLITNALKYSKPGVPPRIHMSSKLVKGQDTPLKMVNGKAFRKFHLIEVKDNGVGFEPTDADRIFNVFTRLHGTESKGSGIGLSIARKVAENHGGHIWAESEPGKGSTFKILLPAD
jgi:PAS domain S-box-containing protein